MIPTHQSSQTSRSKIVVNKLSTLNDYDFSHPHRHDYFEFFCFINGGGSHVIDFKEIPIHSMSIQIVAPGQVHEVRRELDSHGFVYLFALESLQAPSEIEAFLFDHICYDLDERIPEYLVPTDMHDWFRLQTDLIWSDYKEANTMQQLNVRTGIQQLCIQSMSWDVQNSSLKSGEYAEFRRLLFREFRRLKKVKDYASLLNVSEKSLNEMVKRNTGKSASTIIYDQIIMEAKRLLHTGMSAKETAYDLNFDDPAHFSKFFKSQTGVSPSEFRIVHV